jgi:four helix bundle protein
MDSSELKLRTKKLAVRFIRLVQSLPSDPVAAVLGKQLLGSGTSVGANYRSACRAKSRADFSNKLKIVEEEADESLYWMELLSESQIVKPSRLANLYADTNEILSIVTAAMRTMRSQEGKLTRRSPRISI